MSSIDFLQIGHGQQSDARMVVERDVTDSQRIELAAVHRHLFYAVYWIHESQGIHSIDFCDYEIQPDRVFLVRPEQVHVMRRRARYAILPSSSPRNTPISSPRRIRCPRLPTSPTRQPYSVWRCSSARWTKRTPAVARPR